ncbi:hypothetical protein [Nonomuraea sp. B1E8]|uniref:hypothetical protein n=1 Tax=unclassified Nonomuraea TaxID=2593643 RepID=UPI00325E69F4
MSTNANRSSAPPPPGTVVTVEQPITLGERPAETVAFIASLRDHPDDRRRRGAELGSRKPD